ncbi:hypothetical protein YC2023_099370 [Brassica napus]
MATSYTLLVDSKAGCCSNTAEMDRAYLGSPKVVAVLDHEWKRTYVTGKEGLLDTVKNHIP